VIDEHKVEFGVEPICRVLGEHGLQVAPSTYRAARTRPLLARAQRDAVALERIRVVHGDRAIGRGLHGVREVHAQLTREGGVAGRPVSRRQVERLMRTDGLQGARRGRAFKTTRADAAAGRPPDLVQRDVTAPATNRLWSVDFTYVPTWSGHGVHRLLLRRVQSPHRRLAHLLGDAHRATPGRTGDGPVDPPTSR